MAEAVKVVRIQRRISKAELAKRCGLAPSYLSRLEAGDFKSPSVDSMVAIARGLDMDPRDLLVLGGYVPEEFSNTNRRVAEDQITRISQEAIRHISEVAGQALTGVSNGSPLAEPRGFDAQCLAAKLKERRRLAGLTINQVARRSRVPLQAINDLEEAQTQYEPAELQRVLGEGYGLSEQEIQLLRVEMALHTVLRRQPNLSEARRFMIVDVASAAIRRESSGRAASGFGNDHDR